MYLSRIKIQNFRNFSDLDVALGGNIVIVGENRVGKSNLLFGLRLIFDPSLPDSSRQLGLADFWDGLVAIDATTNVGARLVDACAGDCESAPSGRSGAGLGGIEQAELLSTQWQLPGRLLNVRSWRGEGQSRVSGFREPPLSTAWPQRGGFLPDRFQR